MAPFSVTVLNHLTQEVRQQHYQVHYQIYAYDIRATGFHRTARGERAWLFSQLQQRFPELAPLSSVSGALDLF